MFRVLFVSSWVSLIPPLVIRVVPPGHGVQRVRCTPISQKVHFLLQSRSKIERLQGGLAKKKKKKTNTKQNKKKENKNKQKKKHF